MSIQSKVSRMTDLIAAERGPSPRPQEVPPLVRTYPSPAVEVLRWAKTQELSKDVTDQYISVKLLSPNSPTGTETGDAFDATCIFTDAATAANQCLPVVLAGKAILISQIGTTWYIANPTFIKKTIC